MPDQPLTASLWHRAAQKANALPWPEINDALDWRNAQIEALSGQSRTPNLSELTPSAEKAIIARPALPEGAGLKRSGAKAVLPRPEILYNDGVAEDGSIA